MRCGSCGGAMLEGLTTDVTDLGDMVIIRNVPCFKCTECVAVKKSRHEKCFSFFSFFKSGHWPHF